MLLVVVLHMYIPLYILAQCRALESTVAISLKSANWVLQSCQFYSMYLLYDLWWLPWVCYTYIYIYMYTSSIHNIYIYMYTSSIHNTYIYNIHMLFDICFYNIMQLYVVVTLVILIDITWLIPVWRMITALIMTSCGGSVQLPGMQINAWPSRRCSQCFDSDPSDVKLVQLGGTSSINSGEKVNMIV